MPDPSEMRERQLPTRAWSTMVIKSLDEERREIEGIATTPSVDRIGDIVEPMGGKYTLPLPLLWQHRHDQPSVAPHSGRRLEAAAREAAVSFS